MTISVTFNCESVGELHLEMHGLLMGHANRGTTAVASGTVGGVGTQATTEPKKQTAAERKAAEKAVAEAAAAAAGAGSAATPDPAAEKQDAKDEAAETPAPVKLTHDSVRAVLGGYVQAFGMAAAQEDGAKLIAIPKISEIPDTQADLAKAVIAVAAGIEANPYKRDLVGDGITAEKIAELRPIINAAKAVK